MLTDTKNDLLIDLGIDQNFTCSSLSVLLAGESRYVKDIRISLKNAFKSKTITGKEAYLLALGVAATHQNEVLKTAFSTKAKELEATKAEIAEVIACTSLLSANNVLYRFRHFVGKDEYQKQPARFRMNIMMKPVLGKEFFELLSLVISAVNGCELCVKSHEASLLQLDTTTERIFDAIRIGSVITSLSKIIHA